MNLLKDKVPTLVRKLALPAMGGTLFQTFYNVVDTFFAGKISPEALFAESILLRQRFLKSFLLKIKK